MIRAEFLTDASGLIHGFEISGHSGYAERGSDIICAGVSALIETTAMALETLIGIPVDVTMDYDSGYLKCTWSNEPKKNEKTDLLIQTMILGLEQIQEEYPEYLKVLKVEV